jgi:hypothetical protein
MSGIATAFANVSAAFLFVTDQQNPAPVLPVGWLVMWWICARRKKDPIGGWLAYYYYQLFVGIIFSVILVAVVNIHSYVPENFSGERQKYLLFLLSALPAILLAVFEAAVASFLLVLKTWDLVELLRKVLIAQAVAQGIGLVVDATYFPENVPLSLLAFVPSVLWVGYFFRSARVRHVFKTHDWQAAGQPAVLGIT